MTTFLAILNGLAAIPQIAGYLDQWITAIMVWQLQRVTDANKQAIADAAAFALRAKTPEDRAHALDLWRVALSRSRVSQ